MIGVLLFALSVHAVFFAMLFAAFEHPLPLAMLALTAFTMVTLIGGKISEDGEDRP